MAYPVPERNNWKDNFGQQDSPVPPADESKTAQVVIATAVVGGANSDTITITYSGGKANYAVDWGDGTPEQDMVAVATANRQFLRNGSFLIRVRDREWPSNYATTRMNISAETNKKDHTGPGGVL